MPANHQPIAFILPVDRQTLARLPMGDSARKGGAKLLALAQALAASPLWMKMRKGIIVVRSSPSPTLGVIGYFDEEAMDRVKALSWQLSYALGHLRYVSYKRAEQLCAELAAKLKQRLGDGLNDSCFVGIPRGGLIVLGMLAYELGLKHRQLIPPFPPEATLVVVDDCSLSGARFRSFLERCRSRRVLFAHLYSHPSLRAAVEAGEPTVVGCLSARDLDDQAPERMGEGYDAWRRRWLARSGDRTYWLGQPDHICFAWNEPDISIWNSAREAEESGWRVVPPDLCLKNRSAHGRKTDRVQLQPEGSGPLRPGPHTLFGELEGQIVVANARTGESNCLTGVAADMWRSIVECGNRDEVVRSLLDRYEIDERTLKTDLEAMIGQLSAAGLLAN